MKDRLNIEGFETREFSEPVSCAPKPHSPALAEAFCKMAGPEHLLVREAHALAGRHVAQQVGKSSLAGEVDRIADLYGSYRQLKTKLTNDNTRVSASPELTLLVENGYFVDAQMAKLIRAAKGYRKRKVLAVSAYDRKTATRVFVVVRHLFETVGDCNKTVLIDFLQAYQELFPLELGELWLLPDMCALVALTLITSAAERCMAADDGPRHLSSLLDSPSLDKLVMSLRFVETANWNSIVDTISPTERVLRGDPSGHYALMDVETRSTYREAAVKLAEALSSTEIRVAQAAVELASLASEDQSQALDIHRRHVGYYLVGDGICSLASRLATSSSMVRSARRRFNRVRSVKLYVATHVIAASLFWMGWAAELTYAGVQVGMAILLGFIATVALNQTLSSAVNAVIGRAPKARLPRLDYQDGIPAQALTCVTIPCLLENSEIVDKLLVQIENHMLRNRSDHFHFALLTDFPDAPSSHLPTDATLLQQAVEGIRRLNAVYSTAGEPIFHLIHRAREWNPQEGVWMGYERKRGKLLALNRLLLNADESAFSVIEGALPGRSFRYAIVLDGDTQLPSNTATVLVGIMDHPLNRPQIDYDRNRVAAGYTLIQPSIATAPPIEGESWYALLWGGRAGLDPYSHAKANLYHDLFGEGSYHGKGIYDIAALDTILANRLPSNRILSHDLIEGCYGRCTIASDVYLLEEYPNKYALDVMRQLRWMRGDWQIAAWLRASVPAMCGRRVQNTLSLLSRYKIFDNLARSMVEPSILMALLMSTLASSSIPLISALLALCFIVPATLGMVLTSTRRLGQPSGSSSPPLFWRELAGYAVRALFGTACLPYYGLLVVRTIAVTGWRLKFSNRHLLAWRTYSQSKQLLEGRSHQYLDTHHLSMLGTNLAFSAMLLCLAIFTAVDYVGYLVPWAVLWLIAPALSAQLSAARAPRRLSVGDSDRAYLRLASRRTWAFFEDAVTLESNWLPPDHLLQFPEPRFAKRTSPTNIGLALLAICTAYDLGYCGLWDALERLERSLSITGQLERHLGHLYNWYDIDTLQPLPPRYVSTVDSGNFVAHVMAVRQFLREASLADEPIAPLFEGLSDSMYVLKELAPQISLALRKFHTLIEESIAAAKRGDPLDRLRLYAQDLLKEVKRLATVFQGEATDHMQRLIQNVESVEREIRIVETARAGNLDFSRRVSRLIKICDDLISADFGVFFDADRGLLALGMDSKDSVCDQGHYDMLASEARLTAFVAVAKGDVHSRLWYSLGRLHMAGEGGTVLLSWSGSMFEYMMPNIVMSSIDGTLLDASVRGAVRRQIRHAAHTGLPWGVSESGYAEFEDSGNYCYQAFGLPSLGLQPGLGDRRVVAPYACALAAMLEPALAVSNLRRLAKMGTFTPYGFYEAIDFGEAGGELSGVVVMEHMAHHQGMTLLSFANVLTGGAMQARFARDPELRAAQILLAERIPERCDLFTRLD